MRPSRLDRLIYVGPPDAQEREEIFRIRTKTMSIAPDVDIPPLVTLVSSLLSSHYQVPRSEDYLSSRQRDAPAQRPWRSARRPPRSPCWPTST
jgi:AAA family ATPase